MSEKTPDQAWSKVLDQLGEEARIDVFLSQATPVDLSAEVLTLSVPDPYVQEIIDERFSTEIRSILHEQVSPDLNVRFVLISEPSTDNTLADIPPSEKPTDETLEEPVLFNPRYTFDKFIVGPSNRWPHAASLAVAENPNGKVYNPLFIYGGVGLGKTHLLHAIGNYIETHHQELRVLYVSSETFMNDMIAAIRQTPSSEFVEGGSTHRFREKYRSIDVLLIDDIQFLQRKAGTQEEFFHTFNDLHTANKQIILTSDSPPDQIPELEDRLKSRFEWGMITRIDPPELETRIAILQEKGKEYGIPHLPHDVALFIADRVRTNIRALEGSLRSLVSYAKWDSTEITVELARDILKDIVPDVKNNYAEVITVDAIQKAVASYFKIKPSDLKSSRRTKAIALPRHIAMYLSRQMTTLSVVDIGRDFGGRDHSTVLHAYRKIEEALREDNELTRILDILIENIKS